MKWALGTAFSLLIIGVQPAIAAEEYPGKVISVICKSADDSAEKPELIAIDIEPKDAPETACPEGTRYVGVEFGVETVWGGDTPEPWDKLQH